MKQEPTDGSGILLGHSVEAGKPCFLPESERTRHALLIGATGSGKTNAFMQMVEHDIHRGKAFWAIDLRGDFVARIIRLLVRMQVEPPTPPCLIDLRQEDHVVGFNPLRGAGDPHARAFHVLGVIQRTSESFGVQLSETLRNALVAIAYANGSVLDIEPVLTDREARERCLRTCADPYVHSFFGRFDAMSRERQLTFVQPVLNKVTPYLGQPILRALFGSADPINVSKLLDTPGQIVLIALAADRLHDASKLLGSLFLSSFETTVLSRSDVPEAKRVPVTLYVDEFENMAAAESFSAIVAEGRRFGISLVVAHQNLCQVPKNLRDTLRSNVRTQLMFQVGAPDSSELARDIWSDEPKEEVRERLMNLPVGHAFLVRRGHESVEIRTPLSPDPPMPRDEQDAMRDSILKAYGTSRLAVEAGLSGSVPNAFAGPDVPEVRHGRVPRGRRR